MQIVRWNRNKRSKPFRSGDNGFLRFRWTTEAWLFPGSGGVLGGLLSISGLRVIRVCFQASSMLTSINHTYIEKRNLWILSEVKKVRYLRRCWNTGAVSENLTNESTAQRKAVFEISIPIPCLFEAFACLGSLSRMKEALARMVNLSSSAQAVEIGRLRGGVSVFCANG